MLNIKNKITQPPDTYVQYPGHLPPADVYGGSWRSIFDTEGVFFRTPGGNASAFEAGIQASKNKSHNHPLGSRSNRGMLASWNSSRGGYMPFGVGSEYAVAAITTSDTLGGTGDESRPDNRTVRIWKRVS